MGNPNYSSTQALLWKSVCRSVKSDYKVTGGTGKVETSTKISRSLFSHEVQEVGLQRKNIKESGKLTEYDERLHPWVGQATEREQEVGGGRRACLSLISLNNNSRLNPQEFGLSPRKGMNLIIFDPFSNKRAFKLWLLSFRVKDLARNLYILCGKQSKFYIPDPPQSNLVSLNLFQNISRAFTLP